MAEHDQSELAEPLRLGATGSTGIGQNEPLSLMCLMQIIQIGAVCARAVAPAPSKLTPSSASGMTGITGAEIGATSL